MEHLKIDDIIEFVSAEKVDDRFQTLFSTVTGHIRECDQCMELVNAFQMLYDEFKLLQNKGDFGKYVITAASEDERFAQSLQETGLINDYEENK